MFKFCLILGACAVASAAILPQKDDNDAMAINLQFYTPAEMDEMLSQYPNATQFEVDYSGTHNFNNALGNTRDIALLTIGQRQTGDRVVSSYTGTNTWTSLKTASMTVVYPPTGTTTSPTALITGVAIACLRSNYFGRAYVILGGVGQTSISFIVEAINTYIFNVILEIYAR